MKEKILLLPGANGTELTRMLARFGTNTLGLRIMNAAEFARFALMRSGKVLAESFLPRKQEPAVIDGFIRNVSYFSSAGYADSEKMADAFYRLRSLIPADEAGQIHALLPRGEFSDKNSSLVAVYDRYIAKLQADRNIDTIGLLRKAIAEADRLTCPVYTLAEYPLSPLEEVLASCLAENRIRCQLVDLLGIAPAAALRNIDYTESYGSSNEVEAIYDYIVANRIPFDECTVAVANTAQYAQLFYDFAQRQGLPLSLGCGIPILNTNPARLLKLLQHWNTAGYHGVDALAALLKSDAMDRKKLLEALGLEHTYQLDKVITVAGQLRLDFDLAENSRKLAALPPSGRDEALHPAVEKLSRELAQGQIKWLEKYSLIRDGAIGRADRSALSLICDSLDAYEKYAGGSPDQMIPELLQRSVCSENSREGALFVTGIGGAVASMRKHLFIAGMSAGNSPGTPRENYLLLDKDYELFASATVAPTSGNLVQQKKDSLNRLLMLASALSVSIHISYSSYDLAELAMANPSSVLFEIYKQQNGDASTHEQYRKAFRQVGYFGQQISGDYSVGAAYIQGKDITFDGADHPEAPCAFTAERAFSPSALDKFFNCPRHFFLTYILGIKEREEDDPFTVIDPATTGNLAHTLMERLAHQPCDRDTFLTWSADAFDEFLLTRPAIHADAAAKEKGIFCAMMANAYDEDPHNKVLASEEEQTFRHSSGVQLHGYPDRVEKTPDGQFIIADYKTGRRIKHKPDDIDSCLQVVIYAYLMEQLGVPISHCEYRYLRDKQKICCRYDEAMKQQLNDKLTAFKTALLTGEFPAATDTDACKYCTLAHICCSEPDEEEAE